MLGFDGLVVGGVGAADVRVDIEDAEDAEGQDVEDDPSDEGEVKDEQFPLVALHHFPGSLDGVHDADAGVVRQDVGDHVEAVADDDAGDDEAEETEGVEQRSQEHGEDVVPVLRNEASVELVEFCLLVKVLLEEVPAADFQRSQQEQSKQEGYAACGAQSGGIDRLFQTVTAGFEKFINIDRPRDADAEGAKGDHQQDADEDRFPVVCFEGRFAAGFQFRADHNDFSFPLAGAMYTNCMVYYVSHYTCIIVHRQPFEQLQIGYKTRSIHNKLSVCTFVNNSVHTLPYIQYYKSEKRTFFKKSPKK